MQLSEGERQGAGEHKVLLGGGDPGQARSSEEEALNNTNIHLFQFAC